MVHRGERDGAQERRWRAHLQERDRQLPPRGTGTAIRTPVTKKRIYAVFKEECYDNDPEHPWKNQPRLQKMDLVGSLEAAYEQNVLKEVYETTAHLFKI